MSTTEDVAQVRGHGVQLARFSTYELGGFSASVDNEDSSAIPQRATSYKGDLQTFVTVWNRAASIDPIDPRF